MAITAQDVLIAQQVLKSRDPKGDWRSEAGVTRKATAKFQVGERFKESSDGRGVAPAKITDMTVCHLEHNNLHMHSNRGNWCIEKEHMLYHIEG